MAFGSSQKIKYASSAQYGVVQEHQLCDYFFFLCTWQGFPQDLGFWPPRGTSQKKVEFFFFF